MSPIIFATAAAHPQDPVASDHQLRIGRQTIKYTAEIGHVPIVDAATGEPHGFMGYTSYRVPSDTPRPVMFIWNGGPGAPATLLHFEMFGPYRAVGDDLILNKESLLDIADLVFVDPVGTGFSRPAKREYGKEFYGSLGDIRSVTEFVRAWRLLNDAEDTPIFMAGESWGAGRAGKVAYELERRDIEVDGLILISGGSGIDSGMSPNLSRALGVVGWSLAALHHGKLAAEIGTTPAEVEAEVEAWARGIYAPALESLESLGPDEKRKVAEGLALRTGMPVDVIDLDTLRLTPRQFRQELLRAEGKTLNVFDLRLTEEPEPFAPATVSHYFRQTLGYKTPLVYVGVEGGFEQGYSPDGQPPASVGLQWDYFTAPMSDEEKRKAIEEAIRVGGGPPRGGPPQPSTAEALELNPEIRVLVASGKYDSLANCTASKEAQARLSDALAAVVEYRCYTGGHMMYRDEDSRIEFADDVRALMEAAMD